MSEKKIKVPSGMLEAASKGMGNIDPRGFIVGSALEAALRWLSENPIEPTMEQAQYMYDGFNSSHAATIQYCMMEWQRRMFLEPEEDFSEIRDLLSVENPGDALLVSDSNLRLKEAYRRGMKKR